MHWFILRVNWMALFGCRELINIGGGFVAIAKMKAGTMLPDWNMDVEQLHEKIFWLH